MSKLSPFQIWQPFLLSLMVGAGIMIGYKMNERDEVPLLSQTSSSNVGTGRVEQVIRYIEAKYVDSVDTDQLVETAIRSVMGNLDPHSQYIAADELTAFDQRIVGRYTGIGIDPIILEDTIHIQSVYKNTTASDIGLAPFDRLLAIDDKVLTGTAASPTLLDDYLGKHKGKEVTLKLYRPATGQLLTKDFVVQDQHLQTVSAVAMADSLCGYIKIDRFSNNTYEDFMKGLEVLVREHRARHLIIDLRDNPGGLLAEAVDILSQLFVQKGNLLVYTKDKNDRTNKYTSTGKPFFPIDRIAVLINEHSASCSEIVAGAIQDWDRGIVIGRRSFGKGYIQDQYQLSDGSAIRLTTARYYTPSDRCIHYGGDPQDNTFQNRLNSGELFYADSIRVVDSTAYETKRLRRTVYSSGGIAPDLFIPLRASSLHLAPHQIEQALSAVAYRTAYSIHNQSPDTAADFISSWTVTPDRWQEAVAQISDPEVRQQLQNGSEVDKAHWQNIYKHAVSRTLYPPSEVDFLLTEDPFVDRAQEYLLSTDDLSDL